MGGRLDRDAEAGDVQQLDVVLAVAQRDDMAEVETERFATNAIPEPFGHCRVADSSM